MSIDSGPICCGPLKLFHHSLLQYKYMVQYTYVFEADFMASEFELLPTPVDTEKRTLLPWFYIVGGAEATVFLDVFYKDMIQCNDSFWIIRHYNEAKRSSSIVAVVLSPMRQWRWHFRMHFNLLLMLGNVIILAGKTDCQHVTHEGSTMESDCIFAQLSIELPSSKSMLCCLKKLGAGQPVFAKTTGSILHEMLDNSVLFLLSWKLQNASTYADQKLAGILVCTCKRV